MRVISSFVARNTQIKVLYTSSVPLSQQTVTGLTANYILMGGWFSWRSEYTDCSYIMPEIL